MATVSNINAVPELVPHYYRDNFFVLCDTVEAQYADLLTADEHRFLGKIRALDHASQCLFVRLVCRVGPVFRLAKLRYEEIGDLYMPVHALIARGLASNVESCSVSDLASLCTKSELLTAFGKRLDIPSQCRKEQLLESIQALGLTSQAHYDCIFAVIDGDLLLIHGREFVDLLQLLFFGNGYQSLTDFVLSDLGLMTYYPYVLDRNQRFFESRAAIEEYLACRVVSDVYYQVPKLDRRDEIVALAEQILNTTIEHDSSVRRWERLCLRVARELERCASTALALEVYRHCKNHPARERMARICESNGDWENAAKLCTDMQADPLCEAELETAQRIQARVLRKIGGAKRPKTRDTFDEMQLTIPQSASVERDVAQYLSGQWSEVHFVENALMNTLFGLAFWEQIFCEVSGVFHNPYQSVPTDMYDGTFSKNRAMEIGGRLDELRAADLRLELNRARDRFQGYQCRWTDYYKVSAAIQDKALSVIPGEHLLAIWERQLFDPKENRNGFPDLIAFGDKPGEYAMIEVKGPGDRLQDNQRRWLRYFFSHNIPAKVAWVVWSDA
ncbi:MAG: hypothetical protein ACI9DH_000612 [Halioglobus sp.]|jgi:hypothetical protein